MPGRGSPADRPLRCRRAPLAEGSRLGPFEIQRLSPERTEVTVLIDEVADGARESVNNVLTLTTLNMAPG